MRNVRASIDIGSNSTLLLIMDVDSKKVLEERSTITALGKNLDLEDKFTSESMSITAQTLKEYAQLCKEYDISPAEVIVSATEASRVATNANEFFENISIETGLSVITITAEGEAFYTAYGLNEMLKSSDDFIIMDIGGASTELIDVINKPFSLSHTISLPVGSVRTTDWISQNTFEANFESLFNKFDLAAFQDKNVMCVAGTMTALALMFMNENVYSAEKINTLEMSFNEFEKNIVKIQEEDLVDLGAKFPFLGKRLESIKGGALCAYRVLSAINPQRLYFATYGLRYGTLLNGGIDDNYSV